MHWRLACVHGNRGCGDWRTMQDGAPFLLHTHWHTRSRPGHAPANLGRHLHYHAGTRTHAAARASDPRDLRPRSHTTPAGSPPPVRDRWPVPSPPPPMRGLLAGSKHEPVHSPCPWCLSSWCCQWCRFLNSVDCRNGAIAFSRRGRDRF
jgi:hypothetical protein